MKALTVRQPWAWAIIYAGKNVENRSWPTKYRGPLLIHAGLALDVGEAARCRTGSAALGRTLLRGAIIGQVDLVDCVQGSLSPWAEPGCWHWVLENPRTLEPVFVKGRLGLWEVAR